METVKHAGRTFRSTEESRFAIGQIQWAEGILSRANVRFQNGRQSHEAANEVIEQNEDVLIDHLCLVVPA